MIGCLSLQGESCWVWSHIHPRSKSREAHQKNQKSKQKKGKKRMQAGPSDWTDPKLCAQPSMRSRHMGAWPGPACGCSGGGPVPPARHARAHGLGLVQGNGVMRHFPAFSIGFPDGFTRFTAIHGIFECSRLSDRLIGRLRLIRGRLGLMMGYSIRILTRSETLISDLTA